jgi:WD40 repeat protein
MLRMRALIVAVPLIIAALQDPAPWRLVFERNRKLESVLADGTDRRAELGDPPRRGVLSPDGKRLLYDADEEIWIAEPDGRNPKKITHNEAFDDSPDWTPDGRKIVFASNRGGSWQVWIMQSDGGDPMRLTNEPGGVRSPRVSPKGDVVAYFEMHASSDKLPATTLRTLSLKGGESTVVIEKEQMLEFAWSPSGDRLACSLVGQLRILEMPAGKAVRTFAHDKIHKQLISHAAQGLIWRPDEGAIACTMRYFGSGTMASRVYGGNLAFILPFEGNPVTINAGGPAVPVRWMR